MTTLTTLTDLKGLTTTYREPSYPHRLGAMVHGLRQPRTSWAYKNAVVEMQRLTAPIAAILLPALVVALLMVMSRDKVMVDEGITVSIIENTVFLDDWQKHEDPATPEEPLEDTFTFEIPFVSPEVPIKSEAQTPQTSLQPLPMNSVLAIKSRVQFKGLIGQNRSVGTRNDLRELHDGAQSTEDAVMRALRWLKKNQQADGSWKTQKTAMTGLAVLTFLAHGEKPGDSPEFGESVQKALEFLLASQKSNGRFQGTDGNEYAHPIATYALCEAYGMTLNPNIKSAAERALVPILQGQHPTGGWTYRMQPDVDPASGKYRDDTSYMGWCAQALKAAHMARLTPDGLEKAIKLAVRGFKNNTHPNGGFGYTGPGQGGLTGVGTLCLQLLGAANESDVKKSLALMETWKPSFADKNLLGGSLQYYCYYVAQAKFHAGGKQWENWNREMQPLYVSTQKIEKKAIKDDRGCDVDVGWWINGDAHSDRPVMDTCLAALQLMVYYRYLPTTSKQAIQSNESFAALSTDTNDIPVLTGTL